MGDGTGVLVLVTSFELLVVMVVDSLRVTDFEEDAWGERDAVADREGSLVSDIDKEAVPVMVSDMERDAMAESVGVAVKLSSGVADTVLEEEGCGLSEALGVFVFVRLSNMVGVSPGRKNCFVPVGDNDLDGLVRLGMVFDTEMLSVRVEVAETSLENVGVNDADNSFDNDVDVLLVSLGDGDALGSEESEVDRDALGLSDLDSLSSVVPLAEADVDFSGVSLIVMDRCCVLDIELVLVGESDFVGDAVRDRLTLFVVVTEFEEVSDDEVVLELDVSSVDEYDDVLSIVGESVRDMDCDNEWVSD